MVFIISMVNLSDCLLLRGTVDNTMFNPPDSQIMLAIMLLAPLFRGGNENTKSNLPIVAQLVYN